MKKKPVGKNGCSCDLCAKWAPWIDRIEKKLKGRDLKLFEEFCEKSFHEADALGHAEAKLSGWWPGWEWLPKEIERRRNKL